MCACVCSCVCVCVCVRACVCVQVFTPDGSMVDGDILDHKNGTYEFIYTLPKEGHFSLALRLYDQHIKGSPFKLTVRRPCDIDPDVRDYINIILLLIIN